MFAASTLEPRARNAEQFKLYALPHQSSYLEHRRTAKRDYYGPQAKADRDLNRTIRHPTFVNLRITSDLSVIQTRNRIDVVQLRSRRVDACYRQWRRRTMSRVMSSLGERVWRKRATSCKTPSAMASVVWSR